MSYKKLQICPEASGARELSVDIHHMPLQLPKFELYETGRQIRKSSKSIRSNIVEGYGRRRYKQDYIRFLTYAHASVDESKDHLETLFETRSLQEKEVFNQINDKLHLMGKKLYRYIESAENQHKT